MNSITINLDSLAAERWKDITNSVQTSSTYGDVIEGLSVLRQGNVVDVQLTIDFSTRPIGYPTLTRKSAMLAKLPIPARTIKETRYVYGHPIVTSDPTMTRMIVGVEPHPTAKMGGRLYCELVDDGVEYEEEFHIHLTYICTDDIVS